MTRSATAIAIASAPYNLAAAVGSSLHVPRHPLKISSVRATTCEIPLTRPIVMGDLRFDSREYVLVEVETDEGVRGLGYGMTRNAPVAAIVERNLGPLLVGQDPLMTEAIWDRLYYRNLTIAGRGIFMRALSAVDIALWDIKAQVAGQPIWRLLGGARDRAPLTVAGGYVGEGVTLDALSAEVDDYAKRGFSIIKIAAGDLATDTDRIRAAAAAINGRAELAYDAHWAWRDLYTTVPTVARWRDLGLAFIEDPFAPELIGLAPSLRQETGIRLALGEDAVGRWAFQELFESFVPDVVRDRCDDDGRDQRGGEGLRDGQCPCPAGDPAHLPGDPRPLGGRPAHGERGRDDRARIRDRRRLPPLLRVDPDRGRVHRGADAAGPWRRARPASGGPLPRRRARGDRRRRLTDRRQ